MRNRPLSETLALARRAGNLAGVTRLADVSGLTPFAVPVFQAVRPTSRSVAVSQGKGLTPMAAKVSALLEAAELFVAERLPPPHGWAALSDLGDDALSCWHGAPRRAGAVRLGRSLERSWLAGSCLRTGRTIPVPFDLVSLDFTRLPNEDAHASSSGLATGNDVIEATVCAIAELLERDLTVAFDQALATDRHACQIDLGSIDDPATRGLVERVQRAGHDLRLWSLGCDTGVAAFRCVIAGRGRAGLQPTAGSGCHPLRRVAALRAILEAIQVHATLIAGARDDLVQAHYDDPDGHKLEMIFDTLSFGCGPLAWSQTPDVPCADATRALRVLLAAAAARTALPLIAIEHDSGVPGLAVVRVVAPGLADPSRLHASTTMRATTPPARARGRTPVVFIGPTLEDAAIPSGVQRLAPAVVGDLTRLLIDPPAAVGLVDGCFGTAPSVWHKEILALLARGIPVLGAASLGALRAAELGSFGMVGIGRVFAAYRDGLVARDDAVMLVHAPAELHWRALSLSLVDAEAALTAMPMIERDRRMLQRIVRTTPFETRSWDLCFDSFRRRTGRTLPAEIERSLRRHRSIKHDDALALLEILSTRRWSAPPRIEPPSLSSGYARLLAGIMPAPG
ncbi:MAG TPA: YcaO-like family protein [Sphingomonas sp.]|nr:YcaO-like family protein [Sphingomonas sp.]